VTLSVVTAIADPRWEADLVAGLARSSDGVVVVRRCVDVADLLATAAAGIARAVVVSADLRRLDRDMVTRLDVMGVAVVGLVAAGDADAERTLRRLGIWQILPSNAAPDEVVAGLRAAVASMSAGSPGAGSPGAGSPGAGDVGAGAAGADAVDEGAPEGGRLLAVWGPTGAPGRTTVAVGLAAEVAAAGLDVVLADADVYGGTVAQQLGLTDDTAGFATACRLANSGRLDRDSLGALAVQVTGHLRVLTGISRPDRWTELRPSAVDAVLAMAQTMAPYVVVDCGFCLEEDEDLSYDTAAPRRNGATVTALRAAETVVAVGSGDPVGLQRLVRGLAELKEVVPGVAPVVVVNRVRAAAVGARNPAKAIGDALQRFAGHADPRWVPLDVAGVDAAVLAGRTLVEVAAGSPARKAMQALAVDLTGGSVESVRRTRRARPGKTWR
jgi:MinD-like ATPase involved in chromosome partitioning or flagellar assembly